MRVKVFVCPKCQSGVFTRTSKDFRTCTCNAMGVTGGPEQPRLSAGSALAPKIKIVELNLKASAEALQEDWASMADEFGFLAKGDSRLKTPRPIKAEELSTFVGTSVQQGGSGDEDDEDSEDDSEGGGEERTEDDDS